MRLTELAQEELIGAIERVDAVIRREPTTARLPERECTARVYRFLKQQPYNGSLDVLCQRLKTLAITCTDVLIACRLLREASLIEWKDEGDTVFACVREVNGKADLNQTKTALYLNKDKKV